MPSIVQRGVSSLTRLYLRYAPVERGKWWLRRRASRYLVARIDTGPWVRVSGVSAFEWNVLDGSDAAESRTASVFTDLLRPGMVVVDVGANVGYYALTAADMVGRTGRVIAFEPGPAASKRLRENQALNRLSNLTVVEAAASDQIGTSRFHLTEDSEGASMFAAGYQEGVVDVRLTTLDNELTKVGVDRVDLLKIDAEGAEVAVLRGSRRLLSSRGAPPIIIEANPVMLRAAGESTETLRGELLSLGYSVDTIERLPWRGEVTENWYACKLGAHALGGVKEMIATSVQRTAVGE